MRKFYTPAFSAVSCFLIAAFVFLGLCSSLRAQGDGRDGDISINGKFITDSVKSKLSITALAGRDSLFIPPPNNFKPNDEVLIIQMQGASVGTYEVHTVLSVSSGAIRLKSILKNSFYAGGINRAQVIKIKQFNNLTINTGGTLTCDAYDTISGVGGVCFFYAKGIIKINGGKIDVSGKGYPGGKAGAQGVSSIGSFGLKQSGSCSCGIVPCNKGVGYIGGSTTGTGGSGSNGGGSGGNGYPQTTGPGGLGQPGEGAFFVQAAWNTTAQNKSDSSQWSGIKGGKDLIMGGGGGGSSGTDGHGGGEGGNGGQGQDDLSYTLGTLGTIGYGAFGADGGTGGGILVMYANKLQSLGGTDSILATGMGGNNGNPGGNGGIGGNGGVGADGNYILCAGDSLNRAGGGGGGGNGGDAGDASNGSGAGAGGTIWMVVSDSKSFKGVISAKGGTPGIAGTGSGSAGSPGAFGNGGAGGGLPGVDGKVGKTATNTASPGAGGNDGMIKTQVPFLVTTVNGTTFCSGSQLQVSYTCPSSFNNSNTFSVELSDPTGSFATSKIIGSTPSTASGIIFCVVPKNNTLNGTAYRVRVVSSNPIQTSDDNGINLAITQSSSTINGIVRHSNGSSKIDSGRVELYSYVMNEHMTLEDWTTIKSGSYSFSNVPAGEYLILAKPDTALYNNTIGTYYGVSLEWNAAKKYTVKCALDDSANINLYDLPTNPGGKGKISGQVTKGAKYVKLHTVDPLQGVIISIGKKPKSHSNIVAQTTTDVNGDYAFTNLPIGDYKVFVDIPGLPMDSTYNPSVTSTDSIFNNLDYIADSAKIYINGSLSSIANPVNSQIHSSSVKIYPNPFNKRTGIQLQIETDAVVELSLYNSIGQKVSTLEKNNLTHGSYSYEVNSVTSGMYFLLLNVNGNYTYHRITSIE